MNDHKIRLTRASVDKIVRFLLEFKHIESFDLIEEESSGIGSILYAQVEEKNKDFTVTTRYEIEGVETW